MKRNLLYGAALAFSVASLFSGSVFAEDTGFCIEDHCYPDLVDAVNAVPTNNVQTTIKFINDETAMTGSGVIVKAGQNIVFDFDGHSYQAVQFPAGSTGTKSQAFQLLKDSTVYMKNGAIVPDDDNNIKFMIQNYSDLTLDNMTLDASESTLVRYVVSNNFGKMTVTGNSTLTAPEGKVAFDVWYGMADTYRDGIAVLFDENYTGSVSGKIEYGHANGISDTECNNKVSITIEGGDFTNADLAYNGATGAKYYANEAPGHDISIILRGGTFSNYITPWIADGYFGNLATYNTTVEKMTETKLDNIDPNWSLEIQGTTVADNVGFFHSGESYTAAKKFGTIAGAYAIELYDEDLQAVHELPEGQKITVTLKVSDNLPAVKKGYVRTFSVVHNHKVGSTYTNELIASTYSAADNTIVIETDKLSVFTIVYNDVKVEENPETADDIVSFIALAIASVAGVALLAVVAKRKA